VRERVRKRERERERGECESQKKSERVVKQVGKAINIEYGNIEKKGNIESMLSKFENWKRTRNGPPMGWGGG